MANRTHLVNNKDTLSFLQPCLRTEPGTADDRRAEADDVDAEADGKSDDDADENGCQATVPVQKFRRVTRSLLHQTTQADAFKSKGTPDSCSLGRLYIFPPACARHLSCL